MDKNLPQGSSTRERLLSRFVLRSRIVQDHSLAQNKTQLIELATHSFSFVVTVDKETHQATPTIVPAALLPTEQLESAAARVRPIFLKSDGVHYEKVLDAVRASLDMKVDQDAYTQRIDKLRTKFRDADPDYPAGRPKSSRTDPALTNNQIAGAWLYGHLLHEDEIRRTYGGGISLESMLLTATRHVCSEMIATVETLHLIEEMQVRGLLHLSETLFTDQVTVSATEYAPTLLNAYSAPVGTKLPSSFDAALLAEDGWRNVTAMPDKHTGQGRSQAGGVSDNSDK